MFYVSANIYYINLENNKLEVTFYIVRLIDIL